MLIRKNSYKQSADLSDDEILKLYENFRMISTGDRKNAWDKLSASIRKGQASFHKTRSLKSYYFAAAAVILLLIAFPLMRYLSREITISSNNAQSVLTTLPDGSTVQLNAASVIQYKRMGWRKNRLVKLSGEAFFKVQKGKHFKVITQYGNVKVLGTSFNVYTRKNKFSVFCKTGKVQVEARDTVQLTQGMKASFDSKKNLVLNKVNIEREIGWQHGEFWFNNASLSDVFEEIERQFDVVIKHTEAKQRKYSGYFNKQSLHNALTAVCAPMQLHYKQESDKIYIIY
jgi:transmembrane sensor